ncbi:hypothetical protein B0H14DRAFT_3855252 [Mycena olivaceomarginata]|nr:hypothetical protein B0H14DRAFT_3855252 [Mycena olivaceomarginata]
MSSPPMDKIAGYLLIATWASSLLYMSEVYQALYYFRHFQKDGWKLKMLVTVTLVVDTVSIVGEYICVYLYTITYVGDLEYLSNGHWPLPLYALTTGVVGALVQGFLVIRYWHFTQNSLISLVLSLGIIIAFGSVFADCLMVVLYPSFEDRLKVKIPATLWLVTEVAVDVSITSALLWEFKKASSILTETKGTLNRLRAVTIQSGAVAATLAGAGLIAFNVVPETNVAGGFLIPLGRVYVITLLANLNVRKSGNSLSTTVTSSDSGPTTASGEQRPLTLTSWNTDDSYAIHVHHTVHPSVQASVEDPRQPRSPGTFEHPLQSIAVCNSL